MTLLDESTIITKPLAIIYYHMMDLISAKVDLLYPFTTTLEHLFGKELQESVQALFLLDGLNEYSRFHANELNEASKHAVSILVKYRHFSYMDDLVLYKLMAKEQSEAALTFITLGGCKDHLKQGDVLLTIIKAFVMESQFS